MNSRSLMLAKAPELNGREERQAPMMGDEAFWRGASLQPSSEMVSRASSGKRRMRKAPGLGCAKYRGQRTLFVVLAAAGEERAAWVAHRQAHEPTGETR